MAYSVTKNPDGDVSFGSLNGEFVTVQPSSSDYSTGGYALVDDNQVVNTPSLVANTDMYRILAAIPVGGQGGLVPVWNPATKKVQIFRQSAATSALTELPAATDLFFLPFQLLLIGQ